MTKEVIEFLSHIYNTYQLYIAKDRNHEQFHCVYHLTTNPWNVFGIDHLYFSFRFLSFCFNFGHENDKNDVSITKKVDKLCYSIVAGIWVEWNRSWRHLHQPVNMKIICPLKTSSWHIYYFGDRWDIPLLCRIKKKYSLCVTISVR